MDTAGVSGNLRVAYPEATALRCNQEVAFMPIAPSTTDRIHKQVLLHAPRSRIWQSLVNMREFGSWFGVALPDGLFAAGAAVEGQITHPDYQHLTMRLSVDDVEPERRLSFWWHPGAIEPGVDYTHEPKTLVVFELHDAADGVMLTVDESGFDNLPADRRAGAYRGNESGWAEQMGNIARYVGSTT
jgi:uncharacterized protein YndB with AHSA1/START domain